MKGKTSTGFAYNIDDRIINDWRLIEALAQADSDDAGDKLAGTSKMINLLLGNQKDAFEKHIMKNNEGYCPIDAVNNEVIEIFKSIQNSKN